MFRKYNSFKISNFINIPPSTIRAYKNSHNKGISLKFLHKVINLIKISKNDLKNSIIKTYNKKIEKDKILDLGREIRRKNVQEQFNFCIKLEDFIIKETNFLYINTKEWLNKTDWINKMILLDLKVEVSD